MRPGSAAFENGLPRLRGARETGSGSWTTPGGNGGATLAAAAIRTSRGMATATGTRTRSMAAAARRLAAAIRPAGRAATSSTGPAGLAATSAASTTGSATVAARFHGDRLCAAAAGAAAVCATTTTAVCTSAATAPAICATASGRLAAARGPFRSARLAGRRGYRGSVPSVGRGNLLLHEPFRQLILCQHIAR